jgi:hypothetical protein
MPVKAIPVLNLCVTMAILSSVYGTYRVEVKAVDLMGSFLQRDRPYELKFTEE